MNARALAIIPARGGSVRVPRKNIRSFCGRPILEFPVRAALESECFEEVMVSTDDCEIADVARTAGATVPFLRSPETSTSSADLFDAVREVLHCYRKQERTFDFVCCIFPTAALIGPERYREARDRISRNPEAGIIFSILRFDSPVQRALRLQGDRVEMIWPENYDARSQDLEPAFHDAGQFYFFTPEWLESGRPAFSGTLAVVLEWHEAQDIDNERDWRIAEQKFQIQQNLAR